MNASRMPAFVRTAPKSSSAKRALKGLYSVALGMGMMLELAASTPAAAQNYTIKDLGPLYRATLSQAFAINGVGQVVGMSNVAGSNNERAILWDGNMKFDLGVLPGRDKKLSALGINNFGEAVGYATSGYPVTTHAVIFSPSGNIDLGTLGGDNSAARGINDLGEVVGSAASVVGSHAFYWKDLNENGVSDPDEMQKLGPLLSGLHSRSAAFAINNSSQIVGSAVDIHGHDHAFLYEDGVAKDIGTFGGDYSAAYGINENAHVVGWAHDQFSRRRAFVYRPWFGGLTTLKINLGTLTGYTHSVAFGVNAGGKVVGKVGNFQGELHFTDRATLFTYGQYGQYILSLPIDLNTRVPGATAWKLMEARGISDDGKIVGIGQINGQLHGFLLTPL